MRDGSAIPDMSIEDVLRKLAASAGGRSERPRRHGRIRLLDEKKGYGFISPDGGGPDVFFHKSAVQGIVQVYHRVEFDVEQGEKGPRATYVCISFEPSED